jgi:NADPH-dependent curcumin reductase
MAGSGEVRNIPAYTIPSANRQVALVNRPGGIPQREDFALRKTSIPEPGPDQFLVRNIYLSVDPAQRGWAQTEANYSNPVQIGEVMRALAIGVVVKSRASTIREGEFLYGSFGWQDYAVADSPKILLRAEYPIPLEQHAALLGIPGLTAYLAFTGLGHPKPSETVLVSTAAGAVGSMVGQIAKLSGCHVIGLTGEDAKVTKCLTDFGYDRAFNYRSADLGVVLDESAPNGINIFFDNTGGMILDTAIRNMAVGGRIIQCGTASIAAWSPPPIGPRNEREILTRRLIWSGFIVLDHFARFQEAAAKLVEWYLAGKIRCETDIANGIEHAPGAIAALYSGQNRGKSLIFIG